MANTVTSTAGTGSKPAAVGDAAMPILPEAPKPAGRAIAATVGNNDFDLRNASVYRELFKPVTISSHVYGFFLIASIQAGGNTPRSGLSRREKEEERRRELNKMRDEAKAKRLAKAVSHLLICDCIQFTENL